MTVSKKTYKQTDDRWRWWVYPKKGWYLNGCGCGCLSIFNIVRQLPTYNKTSDVDLMKIVYGYMKKYAVAGDGTKRVGITDALKHFGYEEVYRCGSAPMSELFKRLNKEGSHSGVLLFGGRKGPDGTRWTTGGHYIAYSDYRIKNGKHEFFLHDSAGRNHSGWYGYEKSMRGDVLDAWVGKIPGGNSEKKSEPVLTNTEKKPYSGVYPNVIVKETKTISEGAKLVKKADTFCWPYGTDKKKWSYGSGAPRDIYKTSLKKYINKTAKISQSDCGYFVTVCVRSAGLSNSFRTLEWGDKLPSNCKVVHSGKSVPANVLKAGDISA